MIDWSSSARPVTGNDSIWIASGAWTGRRFHAAPPLNISTRVAAIAEVQRLVLGFVAGGLRVLAGFDFAFGYPAGYARALGLDTAGGAFRALHSYYAAQVHDSAGNAHNRDAFAAACNEKIGAPGPFWGCVASAETWALPQRRIGVFDFPHRGLAEWRLTDQAARLRAVTQSVWKLNAGVSVGGQTILGLKHLDGLARAVGGVRWPFEGFCTPAGPGVLFAEVFPSLVRYPEWSAEYARRRDRTQVLGCVRRAAERDAAGVLKGDFAKPAGLGAAALARVQDEEGWILWV